MSVPSVCLAMIVKNESRGIVRTLESIRAHVGSWCIVDTGSTDNTRELIFDTMRGIPGRLWEEPFVDFSTTRNLALDLAVGQAAWTLMLSGDAIVENAGALGELAELASAGASHAVGIPLRHGGLEYEQPILIASDSDCRFRGVTHEMLFVPPWCKQTSGLVLMRDPPWVRYDVENEDRRPRWLQDRELLEAQLARIPGDTRTTFYLAQTYECLGDNARAAELYLERAQLGGWIDERFISLLRRARCLWRLRRTAPEIVQAFHDAYALCPERGAEPMSELADFLGSIGDHKGALVAARVAASVPCPTNARLFLERAIYDRAQARLAQIGAAAQQ